MTSKERRSAMRDINQQIALQHNAIIGRLSANFAFIYNRNLSKSSLVDKFHSVYIINTIALLFTGRNARFPAVVKDDQLSIPLLATVCTLVSNFFLSWSSIA